MLYFYESYRLLRLPKPIVYRVYLPEYLGL